MTRPSTAPAVGDRVRVERDETRYPSRGTWPQFRGKAGTVVEINRDRRQPHLTEYGVVFGAAKERIKRPGTFAWSGDEPQTWFKAHEISVLASQQAAGSRKSVAAIDGTRAQHSIEETAA